MLFSVVNPYAIGKLVYFFQEGEDKTSEKEAYIYASVIVIVFFLDSIMGHSSMMGVMHLTMKLRVACSSLLYRKSLRLSRTALGETTIGQLVNLLSNDVSKFDQGFVICHYLWIAPLQAAAGTYMLYRAIGLSAFFGIAFLLMFFPLQSKYVR